MILYMDTSCLAKIYLLESDSAQAREQVTRADSLITSLIAYPEMRGVFARLERERRLTPLACQKVLRQFESDWQNIAKIEFSTSVSQDAGNLAALYGLRGLDAIHLASAVSIIDRVHDSRYLFLSADKKLNAAARKEGFKEIPA